MQSHTLGCKWFAVIPACFQQTNKAHFIIAENLNEAGLEKQPKVCLVFFREQSLWPSSNFLAANNSYFWLQVCLSPF